MFVDPIDFAACTSSGFTSFRADSMTRATKGAAAIDRGTIVAAVPMLVPTMRRERGKRTIIRMMKGKERRTLTMRLRT